MIRINTDGIPVYYKNDRWKEFCDSHPNDLLVARTNYSHPTITSGMHTNGPTTAWVKLAWMLNDKWICLGRVPNHVIFQRWIHGGWELVKLLQVESGNE